MVDTAGFGIVELGNKWHVSGDVLMDNANNVLTQSSTFNMGSEIEIDFSDVKNVDTAALSLMLEWQRRALVAGSQLKFSNLPASLTSLADLYGVHDYFPLSTN